MTTRSDLPRLAGSLAVLGTELEQKGALAWDRLEGWETGPAGDPMAWTRGGGGSETDAADRKDEARQARRAGEHLEEFRADLAALDDVVQRINRRMDMACPPDVSELRNRRTGEFDPETATDAMQAGWCPNCWQVDQAHVPLTLNAKGMRYYSDRCRPCGDFRKEHGIDKPREIVAGHLASPPRRFSSAEFETIIAKARALLSPKKTKKGKRSKKGKVAA